MKKFAKLILFFSLIFIISFTAAAAFKFLSLRVDWAKHLPVKPETTLTLIISAAHWALSLTIFTSIIFALNYAVRKECFAVISIICVTTLSIAFCFGICVILEQWKSVPPADISGIQLGDKGLILSNTLMNRNETAVILLDGTTNPLGPRIVAIPGQPLVYQQAASSLFSAGGSNFILPPIQFGDDTPWFLKSLSIDISLNAQMFRQKFQEGILPFLLYAGSLIFLLCSLAYVLKFSVWPLANLFITALVFRGILLFNTFFNTPEMQVILDSFLNKIIPVTIALPLFFLLTGALLNVFSFLSFAAKRRYKDED